MGQAQINVRTRACSRTSIARTRQAALTHNVRGKELIVGSRPAVYRMAVVIHWNWTYNRYYIRYPIGKSWLTNYTINLTTGMKCIHAWLEKVGHIWQQNCITITQNWVWIYTFLATRYLEAVAYAKDRKSAAEYGRIVSRRIVRKHRTRSPWDDDCSVGNI